MISSFFASGSSLGNSFGIPAEIILENLAGNSHRVYAIISQTISAKISQTMAKNFFQVFLGEIFFF